MSTEDGNQSSREIDVQLALEILSQRSGGDVAHHHGAAAAPCAHHAADETQALGQVIDLNPQEQSINEEKEDLETQQAVLDQERDRKRAELEAKLQNMTDKELVQAVLEAQQQRVQTYRSFNNGLDSILSSTGSLSRYPQVCAEATAQFAVVSDTINGIQTRLASIKKRQDLAKLVSSLQQQEKEKLNLTAALHLERIRESQGGDERDLALLAQGIQSLERKIGSGMEAVNEIIEELQCVLIDG
ncbi:hypothetical protein MPSEU_000387200 [Mayamaea pseudoterrestris]|nr:hypothetical protein MPSEU_000387200 [Mayamaea pseudoterrestris]